MNNQVVLSKTASAEEVLSAICSCLPEDQHEATREAIINCFAGQWVYFPKSMQRERRNKEMLDKFFNGESRSVICREYHISRSQLHQIIVSYHINARIKSKCLETT